MGALLPTVAPPRWSISVDIPPWPAGPRTANINPHCCGVPDLPRWQEAVFAFMERYAAHVTDFFNLPSEQVVEIGRQISI